MLLLDIEINLFVLLEDSIDSRLIFASCSDVELLITDEPKLMVELNRPNR